MLSQLPQITSAAALPVRTARAPPAGLREQPARETTGAGGADVRSLIILRNFVRNMREPRNLANGNRDVTKTRGAGNLTY